MTDPIFSKAESVHGTTLICGCVEGRLFVLTCLRHTVTDISDAETDRIVKASARILDELAEEGKPAP